MPNVVPWPFCTGETPSPRPKPVHQPPLPPWDRSDSGGQVHTTPPPNLVIPAGYDRGFWRGDIGGVTLPVAPPLVPGGNTTPPEMTMSFLLPWYTLPQYGGMKQVDLILTAHAQRNYSHFHLARQNWMDAGLSDTQAVDLMDYIQSWGFYTSFWAAGGDTPANSNWAGWKPNVGNLLRLIASKQSRADKSIALVGEELNSWNVPGPTGLDNIIGGFCAITNPVGIPTYLHFTSDVPSWQPDGVDPVAWIAQFAGQLTGICSQLNQNDTAGAQGAHLWDTRWRWAAANLDFKVVAFEIMATAQLYGQCSEAYGNLRGLEMLYCPNGAPQPNAPAVAGCGNGGTRYPDGWPF